MLNTDIGHEEQIKAQILEKFPFLENKVMVQRHGRLFTSGIPREHFEQLFTYAAEELGFHRFHHVVGVDDGDDLGFIYILSDDEKTMFGLKQSAPKILPVVRTVTDVFPAALWHERELVDLFGAVVEDLPPGPTYPLPDGWPEGNYPLRKEWKVEYFNKDTMTYNPPKEEHE